MNRRFTTLLRNRPFPALMGLALCAGLGAQTQAGFAPAGVILPTSGYGSTNHYFGRSAEVFGDWALVGAFGLGGVDGEADLFELEGGTWQSRSVLYPPVGLPGASTFGQAVALDDGIAVVGAPGVASLPGSAVVFESQGGIWVATQVLQSRFPQAADGFGSSVALVGDVLLVGAPGSERVDGFRRVGGTWVGIDSLLPGEEAQGFGSAVAFEGGVAAVGAPGIQAAYVFAPDPGRAVSVSLGTTPAPSLGLTRRTRLSPWLANRKDSFGTTLAIWEDRILVGAPQDEFTLGTAYVFEEDGQGWAPWTAFLDPGLSADSDFGLAVAMTGDLIIVGAPSGDSGLGVAYAYHLVGGAWSTPTVLPPPVQAEGQFGAYVAAYGDEVFTSIGIDDSLPFGFYGGAILVWKPSGIATLLGSAGATTAR